MNSLIFRRRSIRVFKNKPVETDKTDLLLKAGLCAPSARNKQPWYFIAVDDRSQLDKIEKVHPYAKMLKQAPLAIIVCGDFNLEENEAYLVQNCSAATQNVLLMATELGLGSVWLGVYPRDNRMQGLNKILNLPKHILPISLIAIGYPDEKKSEHSEFDLSKTKHNSF